MFKFEFDTSVCTVKKYFYRSLSELLQLLGHNNCRNGNDEVRGVCACVCVCVCVCADSHSLLSVTKGNAVVKRTSPTAVDVAGHHGEEDNETAPH